MKRCSIPLIFRDCKSKPWAVTSHPLGWLRAKKQKLTSVDENGKTGTLVRHWWECKLVQPPWKMVWRIFQKLNIKLSYDKVTPPLGIHPKEVKAAPQSDICPPTFIVASFTMAKRYKTDVQEQRDGQTNCGLSIEQNIFQP